MKREEEFEGGFYWCVGADFTKTLDFQLREPQKGALQLVLISIIIFGLNWFA